MAVVLIVSDEGSTNSYTLGRTPIIAGRGKHCNIILTNGLCSGEHCQFVLTENGQAKMMDLGSTNGVSVNGSSALHCKLFLGDEIYMGDAKAWLDSEKMTLQEKRVHMKDSEIKRHPAKPVIKLPSDAQSDNRNGKTGRLLSSGSGNEQKDQAESDSHPHRTSTAVKNIRKARSAVSKNKNK
ncbi:MAG: FHA domain-containing protein [Bdellovibrionota bacterium]